MGWSDQIKQNPFWVLELDPICTLAEAERLAQKWQGMLTLDMQQAQTYVTPWGSMPRTTEAIRAAIAALRNPLQRWLAECELLHFRDMKSIATTPDQARTASLDFLHNRDEEVELEGGREEKSGAYGLYVRRFDDRATPQFGPTVGYERSLLDFWRAAGWTSKRAPEH